MCFGWLAQSPGSDHFQVVSEDPKRPSIDHAMNQQIEAVDCVECVGPQCLETGRVQGRDVAQVNSEYGQGAGRVSVEKQRITEEKYGAVARYIGSWVWTSMVWSEASECVCFQETNFVRPNSLSMFEPC